MSKKARVVLLVAPYFPPHAGGLERYVSEIAQRLASEYAWHIVVVTSGEKWGRDSTEKRNGITVHRLGYALTLSNTPLGFLWPFKLRGILKKERPDLVNVHAPVPGIGDIAAILNRRAPLVVTYHAGSMIKGRALPDFFVGLYETFFLHFLLSRASRIVCSSEALRSDFLSRYRGMSVTIPPAVDSELFAPGKGERDGKTILFVASDLSQATVYKGLRRLIDAAAALRKSGIETNLLVVGDGDMRQAYENKVKAAGLSDSVHFYGRLSGAALADVYKRADIFALPTENDSYPTVLLEAMASALPVVASDVGDIPRIVESGVTGFCVAAQDTAALTLKLQALLLNPALRMSFGEAARAKAVSQMSWAERTRHYHELFVELIEKKHVTHISAHYPPHVGGIERMVEMTSRGLSARGHETLVISSSGTLRSRVAHSPRHIVRLLPSIEFAHTPLAPSLLWHVFRVPRTSILHIHLAQAYWPELVRLAARIRRMTYIVHFHLDVAPSGRLGPLFVLYKRLFWGPLLRGAACVIVCSDAQIGHLVAAYNVPPQNIRVVVNAIHDSYLSAPKRKERAPVLRLLSIARFAPQKRLERLIDAMAHITIPAHLTLVGGGEEEARLKAFAKARGVGNITFLGPQSDSEMQSLHATSDLFLISSEREGLPLAVLEAMAGGVPVIGADAPGVRELLDGVGVVVSEPYAQEFARAIERVASDQAWMRRLSSQSRQKAEEYRLPAVLDALEDVYESL